jgi:hypothetical protein
MVFIMGKRSIDGEFPSCLLAGEFHNSSLPSYRIGDSSRTSKLNRYPIINRIIEYIPIIIGQYFVSINLTPH